MYDKLNKYEHYSKVAFIQSQRHKYAINRNAHPRIHIQNIILVETVD